MCTYWEEFKGISSSSPNNNEITLAVKYKNPFKINNSVIRFINGRHVP